MRLVAVWVYLFGGGLFLPQVPEGPEFRLVSEVRLVVLDVGVRDHQGRAVTALRREAFRVFDSGRPQSITAFAAEDSPVTIGIVLDTSRSMRALRSETVTAAGTLIAESRAEDEMFLVTFNDEVVAGPPDTAANLRRRIEEAAREGRTALYEGIASALEQMRRGSHERKALVLISDGADTASLLKRADVLRQIQLSSATIYAIGLSAEFGGATNAGFLREIAQTSGGDAYIDVPAGELTDVCRRIAREIRSRYMLAFHAAEARKEEARSVRVEAIATDGGRFRVFCRRRYWVLPPQGPRL